MYNNNVYNSIRKRQERKDNLNTNGYNMIPDEATRLIKVARIYRN